MFVVFIFTPESGPRAIPKTDRKSDQSSLTARSEENGYPFTRRLGNPNGAAALRTAGKGGAALRATVTANAEAFARDLAPLLADMRAQGRITLRAIAAELTARGIRTRRGGAWGVGNARGLWGG